MCAALQSQSRQIYQHLIAGEEQECRQFLNEWQCDTSVSMMSLCEELTSAFHSIGDAWECSDISVYREHIATQIGHRLLLHLRDRLPPTPANAPKAIGCSPELDPYTLPSMMVEIAMRELGWNATSLGSDLPLEMLAPAIEEIQPDICWVSVSYVKCVERLRHQLQYLGEKARAAGTLIVCGGQALDDEIRDGLCDITFVERLRDLETIAAA